MQNEKEVQQELETFLSNEDIHQDYEYRQEVKAYQAKMAIFQFLNEDIPFRIYVEHDGLIRKFIKKRKLLRKGVDRQILIYVAHIIRMCDLEDESNDLMFGSTLSKKTVKSMLKDIDNDWGNQIEQ